ncbi:MAG: MoaD/ThiS family protein [Hyphomicrobiales bacterium]|nr:MoaD/ThiS family protein [Hyphomicrobiales bacterium]
MLAKPTITARIKFMGDLPTIVGQRSLEIEVPADHTVRDLLRILSDTYGEAFTSRVFSRPDKLHHYILLFVDGESIKNRGGLDAKLGAGEVDLVMLPMFGGG